MTSRISFVESSGFKAFSGKPATPFYTGQIIMSGGANITLPSGWLWCDGSLFDETVFPELATVLNSAFDNGTEPAGFMRVPDFIGKLPQGGSTGIGVTSGSKSHIHTTSTAYTSSSGGGHTHVFNSVNLSHNHNTNNFGTTSTAAHNHGVNGVNTNAGATRTRAAGNLTVVNAGHTHPITQSNTGGGGDHNHGANGVSTAPNLGDHAHNDFTAVGSHSHTVSGNGVIFSSEFTNTPDVVSVNFMIRAL